MVCFVRRQVATNLAPTSPPPSMATSVLHSWRTTESTWTTLKFSCLLLSVHDRCCPLLMDQTADGMTSVTPEFSSHPVDSLTGTEVWLDSGLVARQLEEKLGLSSDEDCDRPFLVAMRDSLQRNKFDSRVGCWWFRDGGTLQLVTGRHLFDGVFEVEPAALSMFSVPKLSLIDDLVDNCECCRSLCSTIYLFTQTVMIWHLLIVYCDIVFFNSRII